MKISNSKLVIGIDASRAFVKNRTGIEEYSYQVIKELRRRLGSRRVILYTRPGGDEQVDFELPKKWQVKILPWKYIWTQVGLSLEMLFNPVDILFIPAHTIPFIYPRKTFVTVHGLEYEFAKKSYSLYSRLFHRFFIKRSCLWASEIIAVSEKTKNDLIKLYRVPAEKVRVVPNGFAKNDFDKQSFDKKLLRKIKNKKFLFFIGRLEERKNIIGIIKTFEILKRQYNYGGQLWLGGSAGYGYDKIKNSINKSEFRKDIRELGFIREKDKWIYLRQADLFLFPSLFEGFGIPILEAQSVGTPVITSDRSPMKEVVGDERVLVKPNQSEQIAKTINKILQDKKFRDNIIKQGLNNIKKYSWDNTVKEISKFLQ